jgi:hypothetical protein
MEQIDLGVESLLAEARERTGLSDFGDPAFRTGLGVLVETYERAGLTEKGRRSTRRRLVQLLANRLRIAEAFRRHPEIREREIRSPVYLTGLPRTGTSALFNVLGVDPVSRPLLTWEGMFPDPCEGLPPGADDPRLLAMRERYEKARAKGLEFDAIHYVRPDGPEECVLLQAHAFCDAQVGIEPLMEPYGSWFERQDLRAMYAYYRDLLKLLDWQRPGERWLLKSPAHLWALDVLVEMFPDVCIIWTHRNPLEIIPSYCSMIAALMGIRESVDPQALGRRVLDHLALSLERGLAARDRSDSSRFVDVDYRELVADPMATVRRIYGAFGLPLPAGTLGAMERYVAAEPQAKHGAHRYSLEQFGLTPEMVRARLADYIARFGLPADARAETE